MREELKETKVTVTCLVPGATETKFFDRAGMMDTEVGTTEKDDPAEAVLGPQLFGKHLRRGPLVRWPVLQPDEKVFSTR